MVSKTMPGEDLHEPLSEIDQDRRKLLSALTELESTQSELIDNRASHPLPSHDYSSRKDTPLQHPISPRDAGLYSDNRCDPQYAQPQQIRPIVPSPQSSEDIGELSKRTLRETLDKMKKHPRYQPPVEQVEVEPKTLSDFQYYAMSAGFYTACAVAGYKVLGSIIIDFIYK